MPKTTDKIVTTATLPGKNSRQPNMDTGGLEKLTTHNYIIETDPKITAFILQNGI